MSVFILFFVTYLVIVFCSKKINLRQVVCYRLVLFHMQRTQLFGLCFYVLLVYLVDI